MNSSNLIIISALALPFAKRVLGSTNEKVTPPVPSILQQRYGHINEDRLSERQRECYLYGFKGVMPLPVFLDLWRLNPKLVNLELLEEEYEITGAIDLNTSIIPYMPWYPEDIRGMFTRLYDSPRTALHVAEFEIPENIPMLEGINCFELNDPNKFEYYRDIVFSCFDPANVNMRSGIWVYEHNLEGLSDFIRQLTGIHFLSLSVIAPENPSHYKVMPIKFLNSLGSLQKIDYLTSFKFDYYRMYIDTEASSHYDMEVWKLLRGMGSRILLGHFRNFPPKKTIISLAPTWKNKTLLPWILSLDPIFEKDNTSELRRF